MKKASLLLRTISILILGFFVSCSGVRDVNPKTNLSGTNEDLIVFQTMEDFNRYLLEGIDKYTTKITDSQSETTRANGVNILTLKGYTSMTSEGYQKGLFSPEVAARIGIPSGIYIFAKEHYFMRFKLGDKQYIVPGYPADHSKCGYMPSATNTSARGYSMEQDGRDVTLSTFIIHFISDLKGHTVGLYSPLGYDIRKLEWSIPYITTL